MSRPKAISRCTARVAKQVNKLRYHFSRRFPCPCKAMNGPPRSTAVLVNARKDDFNLDRGNGAIICSQALAFRRRHSAYIFSHSRMTSCPDMTQYRADSAANVWFVPDAWCPFSWNSFTISFVTQLFRGKIIGYLTSYDRNLACFKRLLDRIRPSLSSFGCKPKSLLLDGNGLPHERDCHSSRK